MCRQTWRSAEPARPDRIPYRGEGRGFVGRTVGRVNWRAHGYVRYLFSTCARSQRLESGTANQGSSRLSDASVRHGPGTRAPAVPRSPPPRPGTPPIGPLARSAAPDIPHCHLPGARPAPPRRSGPWSAARPRSETWLPGCSTMHNGRSSFTVSGASPSSSRSSLSNWRRRSATPSSFTAPASTLPAGANCHIPG